MILHRMDYFSLPNARVKNTREPNYKTDDTIKNLQNNGYLPNARVKNTREPNNETDDTGCVH